MGGIDFTPLGILTLVFNVLLILFSLSVHESAHAWMANRLGDPTGRMLGRITLNPIPHIDPVGTLVMPAVLSLIGAPVFGWAKPVPVISRHFKHVRRDEALVGAAGPLSNLAVAVGTTGILGILLFAQGPSAFWTGFESEFSPAWWLLRLALVNVVLAGFNLIPIPPLDGSWVLSALLPGSMLPHYERLRSIGPILLLVLFFTPLMGWIIRPIYVLLYVGVIHIPLQILSSLLGG
ncbi:MAG: site-2 protease family protein [Acidobacteriota bacterium]